MSTPSTHPNPSGLDAHRRGRIQEGVAIGLALLVLVATFVVAATSVAGETVSSASRTDGVVGLSLDEPETERCEQSVTIAVIADGSIVSDHVCSFGPSHATTASG